MKHGADTVMDDYEKNVFRPDERERGSGPLGREAMAFRDKMVKYHGEIERLVYAAEISCKRTPERQAKLDRGWAYACSEDCSFHSINGFCKINILRSNIGDHVQQHDIPQVPPCQCAGNEEES